MSNAVPNQFERFRSIRVPRRRWWIASLLGFGVLVNYFDRVNLSVSQAALHEAFGISTVTFGYLLSAYSWTYASLQLPSGLLLDRFGVRRVGLISTILWSVASFGAAISAGIGAFFAARFLLGIGEAPTFPANAKAVGYWRMPTTPFPAVPRGEICFSDRRSDHRNSAAALRLEVELCCHRVRQPALFWVVLWLLSQSE